MSHPPEMHFPREMSTNNTAEYEGLLAGHQSPLMEDYVDEVRKLEERFDSIQA